MKKQVFVKPKNELFVQKVNLFINDIEKSL